MDLTQVRQWVSEQLKAGKMEALGRPRINGIDWPYVKIPQRYWKYMTFDWADSVKYKGREYVSILLKPVASE
jgi:hypothetical protein